MSIKEIAERHAWAWRDRAPGKPESTMTLDDIIERAIREAAAPLVEALGALGAIGGGYCFCGRGDRDPDKLVHQPECGEARKLLAEWIAR